MYYSFWPDESHGFISLVVLAQHEAWKQGQIRSIVLICCLNLKPTLWEASNFYLSEFEVSDSYTVVDIFKYYQIIKKETYNDEVKITKKKKERGKYNTWKFKKECHPRKLMP